MSTGTYTRPASPATGRPRASLPRGFFVPGPAVPGFIGGGAGAFFGVITVQSFPRATVQWLDQLCHRFGARVGYRLHIESVLKHHDESKWPQIFETLQT